MSNENNNLPMKKAFTVKALAERWSCSGQHIRDLISKGKLPAFRAGRLIRIPYHIVEAHEQCEISSGDPEDR